MLRSARERFRESIAAFRAIFTNPSLRRIEIAWAANTIGAWAYAIALAVYAYDVGGAAAVGLVGVIRVIPAVVAAPFAGVLGDRYPRHRVMWGVSLVRTGVMAIAAISLFANAPPWVVYTLAGAASLTANMVRPIFSALLPQLAKTPEELTAANLVLATIESAGVFLGPALGGVLLAATNPQTVFAATAVAYLVATVALFGIETGETAAAKVSEYGFMRDFFAGFGAILGNSHLRLIIGLYGSQTLIAGALNVLIVVAALEMLDIGESGVGFLNSAVGIGGLLGAVVAFALVGRQRLASDFALGLVLWGIPIALIGVFPNAAVAIVLLAIVGMGNTVVDVAALTLLQRTVPDEVLTRVFGVVQSVFVGTIGLGAIVAPILIDTIGIRWALVVTGSFLPVVALLRWGRIRALDAEALAPTKQIELLRAMPLFQPLPATAIDQLASSLIPVHAEAGTQVIKEGESGDRFYVISSGEVDVSTDGKHVAVLGPGDHFGEIALLRDVPRTATVTAKGDVDLYALERDEFLSAVTGHPESAEAADAVVATRLAGLRPGLASV
jgi:MFS family permease